MISQMKLKKDWLIFYILNSSQCLLKFKLVLSICLFEIEGGKIYMYLNLVFGT